MNKSIRKMTALTGATAVACTLIAGCGKEEAAAPFTSASASSQPTASVPVSTEPVKLSIISPDSGRVVKEGNPVFQEIEKKTNTKIQLQLIPSSEFTSKYGVIIASGAYPDISRLNSFEFQKYAGQGAFLDLGPLLTKENAPNLLKNIKQEEWDLVKYQGKQYAIPYLNKAGKYVHIIRQDWLDNLGLTIPTNLQEYENVVRQFTKNDPDKNGKNDTYGIGGYGGWGGTITNDFSPIFGAYGMQPGYNYMKDNKVFPTMISDEYKAVVTYIAKLYSEKLIDPEIFTIKGDQAAQKLAQSKSGTATTWWSVPSQTLIGQLKMNTLTPAVKWNPVPGLKGPDGKSGMPFLGVIGGTVSISSKVKDPVAALKFIDYLNSDEGFETSFYGVKGVHYTEVGKDRTAAGDAGYKEKWLDSLSLMVGRPDLQFDKWPALTTNASEMEDNRWKNAGYNYNLYQDFFYGLPKTEEEVTLDPDLKKYEMEAFIRFVTGAAPLSQWDEYVSGWKTKGGLKVLESKIKAYNELFSKSYASGIK
ncbi:MAG: extracellular solute-binding protein family 1 [Paenibacillaceae bacterium]|jgi:putative aldouronate transport system substrate-binding protein|nr:extracellular solute-binding protein family 1 [Paenibacillaceae bacterium]